jgi:hypothetical protein
VLDWKGPIRDKSETRKSGRKVFMDDKPQEEKPPRKRKVEIDLRDLFADKDVKGGAGPQKPEPPAKPEPGSEN